MEEEGVYAIGRAFGDNFAPIYIGETENLQKKDLAAPPIRASHEGSRERVE